MARLRQGNLAGALEDTTAAIGIDPNYLQAYCHRGQVYEQQRDLDSALRDFEKAIELGQQNPDPEAYDGRGRVRQAQHLFLEAGADFDKAIEGYDTQIALEPKSLEARRRRAAACEARGNKAAALQDYTGIIRLQPDDPAAYLQRGPGLAALRRSRYGPGRFQRGHPAGGQPEGGRGRGGRARRPGRRVWAQQKFGLALGDANRAIALKGDDAEYYDHRGKCYLSQGQLAQAVVDFDSRWRLKPDLAVALQDRSIAWRENEKFDAALADAREAARLQPRSAEAYFVLGVADQARGNLQQAIADLSQALGLTPTGRRFTSSGPGPTRPPAPGFSPWPIWARCWDRSRTTSRPCRWRRRPTKRWESPAAPLSYWGHVVQLTPGNALAYLHRGDLFAGQNDLAAALIEYNTALKLDPTSLAARLRRAVAYRRNGQPARALDDLAEVLRQDSHNADAYYQQGLALHDLGRGQEAIGATRPPWFGSRR